HGDAGAVAGGDSGAANAAGPGADNQEIDVTGLLVGHLLSGALFRVILIRVTLPGAGGDRWSPRHDLFA
ncbi:hypothetical protein, partial [Acetobacter oeni]|uniref:hypothetical protein n=1 Tax=Acetobacter oeni TaxID=304077 RepID=UPI002230B9DC